jgi:hypothetical protein
VGEVAECSGHEVFAINDEFWSVAQPLLFTLIKYFDLNELMIKVIDIIKQNIK